MVREKQITIEKLLLLGAQALAELVEDACDSDKYLRQRVNLRLTALDGIGKLDKNIARRIAQIARGQFFIDWQENPDFAHDLSNLRLTIMDEIAALDPALAVERMWQLVDLSEVIFECIDDSSGMVGGVLQQAVEDLGALWAKVSRGVMSRCWLTAFLSPRNRMITASGANLSPPLPRRWAKKDVKFSKGGL